MNHQARLICVRLEGSAHKFRLIGLTVGSSIKHECVRHLRHRPAGYSRVGFAKRTRQRRVSFAVKRS